MNIAGLLPSLLIAAILPCAARAGQPPAGATPPLPKTAPSPASWKAIRDQQPPGLHLALTLPKTRYFLGEVIPAKLIFWNDSQAPWHLWTGTYDRSGRIPDIALKAKGQDGSPVGDPLKAYFQHSGFSGGGVGNFQNLGSWEVTLPANQWLKFEKPGQYQLFAQSSRVRPGDTDTRPDRRPSAVELVSDPVTITIEPLSPEEEAAVISKAETDLASPQDKKQSDDPKRAAIERLRFLQTPAACDVLLRYIDSPYSNSAILGLCSFFDNPTLADKILDAVKKQKIGITDPLLACYAGLRNGGGMFMVQPGGRLTAEDFKEELYASARAGIAANGQGNIFFANLLALFLKDPSDPAIRGIMIQRQLDLPAKQVDELLKQKKVPVGADFLPLLRLLVTPEQHNPWALAALAAAAPAEARPIIIADIQRDKPLYIPTDHVFRPDMDFFAHEALPERELPELDPILKERLRTKSYPQDELEATMILIERYATKALLPEVTALCKTYEGHWQCVLQASALRYWIRCDPAGGVSALEGALKKNGENDTGCFHTVLSDVLQKAWVDEALPLVLAATKNEDLDVVRSAATVLEAHAGPEAIEPIIAAVERIAAQPLPKEAALRDQLLYEPRGLTSLLVNSKRWSLTPPQLERLKKAARQE